MNTFNELLEKYEFFNHRHAREIIENAYPDEWKDIVECLTEFHIEKQDLLEAGGSETNIPGKIEGFLSPRKWKNMLIKGDLLLRFYERRIDQKQYEEFPSQEHTVHDYLNGAHVDYLKNRVAICLEWNKKDLSFDRVLSSFRTFHENNIISAGVIITRSADLNSVFKELGISKKYGTSSTWIGRLNPRIESGQAGECPILAIGIKSGCMEADDE